MCPPPKKVIKQSNKLGTFQALDKYKVCALKREMLFRLF